MSNARPFVDFARDHVDRINFVLEQTMNQGFEAQLAIAPHVWVMAFIETMAMTDDEFSQFYARNGDRDLAATIADTVDALLHEVGVMGLAPDDGLASDQ